ncbi:MAG: hypothetical protein ACPIEU_07295 [Candidatus Puniceispirillaceae bacterium]|jgi:hypothetical protein
MRLYQKSLIPISGVIYGQTIYWLTLASSFLVLLGTIVSFLERSSPLPASYLLQSVIDGKSKAEIWGQSSLGNTPDMLFFLANPTYGESITMIGLGLGVSSVVPATFFASYFLRKSRNPVFAVIAVLAGLLTCLAISGAAI